MGTLTSAGYTRKSFDEWVTDLASRARSEFGNGIRTDADSVLGKNLRLMAYGLAQTDEGQEAVYQAFDSASATGVAQDNGLGIFGLTRLVAEASTVTLTLTGTDGTVISAGTQFRNPTTGDVWATDSSATIPTAGPPTGTVDVAATCTVTGPTAAIAGTITEIVTPVAGLTAVTNAADAAFGRLVETAGQARQRRLRRIAAAGNGTPDSIRAAVLEDGDANQVEVYENTTDSVDADGRPAHSFEVVTQGISGATEIAALAATIWEQKPAGIPSYGISSTTTPDANGTDQTVYYSEATTTEIYTRLTSTTMSSGTFTSGKQTVITQALLDAFAGVADTVTPAIGEIGADVYYEAMRAAVFGTVFDDGTRIVSGTFRTGTSAPASGTTDIVIGVRAVARLQTANIAYS